MTKIKLLKASPFYNVFMDDLYLKNPGLSEKDFQTQYKIIMDSAFWEADFYKKNLERTGRFEVMDVVMNASHLQKQWAKEHNVKYSQSTWIQDILEAQITEFKPDIFFAQDFPLIEAEFKKRIKKKYPFVKLILAWDGIVHKSLSKFAESDVIMTPATFITDYYTKRNINAFTLPFGFEKSILDKIKLNRNKYDTSFVGGVSLFKNAHYSRLKLLNHLSRNTDIELFLSGLSGWKMFLVSAFQTFKQGKIKEFITAMNLQKNNKGSLFGIDMYQALADSKITINSHIDRAGKHAANIRLFEATGTGTCLLTDWKENLSDYFEIDKEVVAYKSPEDCAEKIKWLLKNEDERIKIAKAGQKKTLEKYSFENRMKIFEEKISKYL
ncbi:MAG: glycosyltransferase [Bacteroidota bacterium]|nr:glycosyltransferase [Bacteroidota bacterium]